MFWAVPFLALVLILPQFLPQAGDTRFVGDRNQMPVYPFLQSLSHDPHSTVDEE